VAQNLYVPHHLQNGPCCQKVLKAVQPQEEEMAVFSFELKINVVVKLLRNTLGQLCIHLDVVVLMVLLLIKMCQCWVLKMMVVAFVLHFIEALNFSL
jgi:hypothetical protein